MNKEIILVPCWVRCLFSVVSCCAVISLIGIAALGNDTPGSLIIGIIAFAMYSESLAFGVDPVGLRRILTVWRSWTP